MKKVILILLVVLAASVSEAQITIKSPAKKVAKFDSLTNRLPAEEVEAYIGQTVFIIPKAESLRKSGYSDFYITAEGKRENVYKLVQQYSYNTNYETLAGKNFEVVGVERNSLKGPEMTYIKLTDGQDTFYYEYPMFSSSNLPFLVVGYFEKLKQLYVGQSYYLFKQPDETWSHFETGEPVKLIAGSLWECVDIVLDGEYFNSLLFVMENDKAEKISDIMERVIDEVDFITKETGDSFRKKYGVAAFKEAMNNPD